MSEPPARVGWLCVWGIVAGLREILYSIILYTSIKKSFGAFSGEKEEKKMARARARAEGDLVYFVCATTYESNEYRIL